MLAVRAMRRRVSDDSLERSGLAAGSDMGRCLATSAVSAAPVSAVIDV